MTIDINELRRKVNSTDIVDHVDIHANVKPVLTELLDRLEAAEKAVNEAYQRGYAAGQEGIEKELAELRSSMKFRTSLIGRTEAERDALRADKATLQQMTYSLKDRLEVAESARRDDYQNWMTALDRNAELLAKLEAAEKERDALRAKVNEMERQVPICLAEDLRYAENLLPALGLMPEDKLYALPGAKGEEK